MTRIVTGAAFELGVHLTKDKQPFIIPLQATIQAGVVDRDHKTELLAPVTVSPANQGTDLNNSHIIVKFTPDQTQQITRYGPAFLKITIAGAPQPWYPEVHIYKT